MSLANSYLTILKTCFLRVLNLGTIYLAQQPLYENLEGNICLPICSERMDWIALPFSLQDPMS